MRSFFPQYHQLTSEKLDYLWENSIVIVDSNFLLNLYKYSESTRNDFFSVLSYFKKESRLWLLYQVAYEFNRARPKVM